ncbi:TetR/AcrR family transcriptional regulator [Flagellimonas aquimarina]|uniref:TetR/AcrR family transcriptional regulator n=1 Tax=Flagellimonas aquimarina TaxID=2201895 RepID=A0A316L2H0_9FLAO|nr:TetR/AcrR family transcriptional regulator [Allomuricauda koreensis]PWL39588.1 TetR/AcrR family transcriptional regulator [Allomuricauda koreensis]
MPRVKQFNEEEILKKAMELFWERGFHATSIQNLVSHLGINRASLYDTFGGKEELFNRAFKEYRSKTGNVLKEIFDTEDSVRAGLKKLFDMAIDEAKTDQARKGCFVVNTTTELIPGDEAIHKVLSDNKTNIESLFINYLQKGIDNGEIDVSKNAESIGLMFFALYSGLRVLAKVDSDSDKLNLMVQAGLSVLD